MTTRNNVANWTGDTGNAPEALRLLTELLPDIKRVFIDPDHPLTLTVRCGIAHWTGAAGESQRALSLFRELLPIEQRVRGPNHPETVRVRDSIGRLETQGYRPYY
ncbi:MAG: tetratricopeptide repeat protein [Burkholderiales bacterium]